MCNRDAYNYVKGHSTLALVGRVLGGTTAYVNEAA